VRIERVELVHVAMPLVAPFRTSFGTQNSRDVLLLRIEDSSGAYGWGECVAPSEPGYSSEYTAGAELVLRSQLLPRVLEAREVSASSMGGVIAGIPGHLTAKAALEMAVLDLELRAAGMSLGRYLGATRTRVACGVSVGIQPSIGQLLDVVAGYLAQGYLRIKLKIEPGWDVAPLRAVRERFGDDVALQVDANTAYRPADLGHLLALDSFGLVLVEQPFGETQVRAHVELARRLRTPVCLDETITSAQVCAEMITAGACSVVNIKPGRVGGYLEARRIHDVAAALGAAAWCGGMLETGLGRAANLAVAGLPNCVLPGDTSASDRYFARDITAPFVLDDGHLPVPTGPGIGIDVDPDALAAFEVSREAVSPPS
jgi:O-succinylbenzoate synthase